MKSIFSTGLAGSMMALAMSGAAQAGPASDAFGKCLVESSTGRDRIVFVQWFFTALSVNPNVQAYVTATKEQRADVSRKAVGVLERLVLNECHAEAVAAIRADGAAAIQTSFGVFGQSAAGELMSDPAVTGELNAMSSFMDEAKWEALAKEAKK